MNFVRQISWQIERKRQTRCVQSKFSKIILWYIQLFQMAKSKNGNGMGQSLFYVPFNHLYSKQNIEQFSESVFGVIIGRIPLTQSSAYEHYSF